MICIKARISLNSLKTRLYIKDYNNANKFAAISLAWMSYICDRTSIRRQQITPYCSVPQYSQWKLVSNYVNKMVDVRQFILSFTNIFEYFHQSVIVYYSVNNWYLPCFRSQFDFHFDIKKALQELSLMTHFNLICISEK